MGVEFISAVHMGRRCDLYRVNNKPTLQIDLVITGEVVDEMSEMAGDEDCALDPSIALILLSTSLGGVFSKLLRLCLKLLNISHPRTNFERKAEPTTGIGVDRVIPLRIKRAFRTALTASNATLPFSIKGIQNLLASNIPSVQLMSLVFMTVYLVFAKHLPNIIDGSVFLNEGERR